MNIPQYMPFFLTAFVPCFLVLVGMWMNNQRFGQIDKRFEELNTLVRHFIDISMDHGERIATLEERTGKKAS